MSDQSSNVQSLLDDLKSEAYAGDAIKDEKKRLLMLSKARKLVLALEDPQESIAVVAFSANIYMVVRLAVELGLPELLVKNGKSSVEELASEKKADPALVLRILRTLAAMDFVDQVDDEMYAPNRITEYLAVPRIGAGIRHWFDFGLPSSHASVEFFKENDWKLPRISNSGLYQLGHNVKTSAFTHWNSLPGVMENFNMFMPGFFRGLVWLEWFPIPEVVFKDFDGSKSPYVLVDVAGGVGRNLETFYQKFGDGINGKVALEDQPQVIDGIKELDQRVERIKYDFFTPNPIKGAHVYFFQSVMHDWLDVDAARILSNTAASMYPGYSKLLIADIILPDKGATLRQTGLDIGMLVLHSGMQRSEKQWQEMISLVSPPLKIVKFWHPPGDGAGIVEIERA